MTVSEPPRFAKSPDLKTGGDPLNAQLLAALTALTAEVAILRDRLDAHERLSQRNGGFGPEAVDRFEGDAAAIEARQSARQRLISNVFRVFLDRRAATKTNMPLDEYEDFVGTLERD